MKHNFFIGQKIFNIRNKKQGVVLDIHEKCNFMKVLLEGKENSEWWLIDEWSSIEE